MMQHFRVYKPKICSIVRNYGSQRYQPNYYEILKVSSDASQEDIKKAFIKLSKQLHPDTSGKRSHTDFVRLNEAYSVLGKASARRKYDEDLKYGQYTYKYGYSQDRRYGSRWEYEVRTAGGPWPPKQTTTPNPSFGFAVAMLFVGLSLFQLFFMLHSMRVRRFSHSRSIELERQYQQIKRARDRPNSTCATNLNEFITEDDREC